MAISQFDYYTNNIKPYLLTVADSNSTVKGYVKFTSQPNPQTFTFYSISGSVTDSSTYVNLTITYVAGSTSPFTNNEDMFLTFSRTGDIGNIGYTGSQGESTYTYSDNPPANPAIGDRWFDSSLGIEFIWTDDGDGLQWVELAASGFIGTTGYTGSAATSGKSIAMAMIFGG
jgi:hypothetical protein